MDVFCPVPRHYDPLAAGSIDGTDTVPHDRAIVRAMNAKYKPNKGVTGAPECTVFIGRLNYSTTEDTIQTIFSRHGSLVKCRLVRDIVTGFSKGYAFVEYSSSLIAEKAVADANGMLVDDKMIYCDLECERTLKGWVPRRLGGGLSGRKESGQLRFGGRDRPFRKPIMMQSLGMRRGRDTMREEQDMHWERDRERFHEGNRSGERREYAERHRSRERNRSRERRRSKERNRTRERRRSRNRDRSRDRSRDRKRPRD